MSLSTLPTNRRFLTHLFNSLAPPASPDPAAPAAVEHHHPSPLDSVPDTVKKQLLALQVLFPTEFVPALDVLDRRLVTRFRVQDSDSLASAAGEAEPRHEDQDAVLRLGDEQGIDTEEGEEAHMNDDVEAHKTTRRTTTSDTGTMQDPPISNEEATTTTHPPPTDPTIPPTHHQTNTTTKDSDNTTTIYYVRSAQHHHHRSSRYTSSSTNSNTSYDPTPSYQVRLSAWNCSCPAFTFAAFPALASPDPPAVPGNLSPTPHPNNTANHNNNSTPPQPPPPTNPNPNPTPNTDEEEQTWSFGGISLGTETPPVCKHLLACLLAEKCSQLFGGDDVLQERSVSLHEAVGWAAGWGD